jgi:hypothetical protein
MARARDSPNTNLAGYPANLKAGYPAGCPAQHKRYSVAEPPPFSAAPAPAPGVNFYAAPAPAAPAPAPAPTLLYSKAKFLKRTKV